MARKRGGRPPRGKATAEKAAQTATPKEGAIEVEGTIVEPLPNAMFRVELTTATAFWPTYREKFGCTSSVFSRGIASWSSYRPTT